MNRTLADKIAAATLYEGYILYPYRPSVKSQQRWTFGGIYPKSWSDAQKGTDPHTMQTEVLVTGPESASVHVIIRFLHLVDRTVGQFPQPLSELPPGQTPPHNLVQFLEVGETRYQPWQEATEREVDAGEFAINDLIGQPREIPFSFASEQTIEPLKSPESKIVGVLIRRRQMIEGLIKISAAGSANEPYKITAVIQNLTPLDSQKSPSRDDALMRSLVSMHVILGVRDGEFLSLTDPPDPWQAAGCKNIGLWPVLIGVGTEHDTLLASPIILYDYPQLAPESPGDLFDATEIDEILTLRILTLTDEEKRNAASVDPRAREMLARTEALARDQLMNLHGTIRGLRPTPQEQSHG